LNSIYPFIFNAARYGLSGMSSLVLSFAVLLLLTGCIDEPVRDASSNTKFVNLATFIEEQTALLDSLNPAVDKEVRIGGKYERQTLQNINWQRELDLFLQADISKPALQAAYDIEDGPGNIRIFRPRTGENPNIQYLKVRFGEQGNEIKSIEAHISQSNYLYRSERKFSLQCKQNSSGQTQIAAYQITGFQKLIFNKEVPYEIQASVL
jgi:hypothetical protein